MKRLFAALRSPSPILLAYAGAIILFVLTSLYSPGFASPNHIGTLIIVAAFTGIVAIGQTMVIIGGGIDLSVPWVLTCAGILVTGAAQGHDGALIWAVPLLVAAGAVVGVINGIGVALLRVPAIVMTLSTNVVLQGLLLVTTSGTPMPLTPPALQYLATGRIGPVPVILVVWVVLTVAIVVVERLTAFGRYLYAIGSNRTVALFSGVPVARTTVAIYAVSGATAALAGVLLTGYSRQAYLGMGDPYLFTSIAAVAIGGASILGGSGSYLGTIAGAFVLTILTGLLPIFRLSNGALQVVYGVVILITVSLAAPAIRSLVGRAGSRGS